jgi:ubiquinone/menaquinone biosynthesis C-methylase UbiE/uncharacterized protein YbaR (Trm112 family)
MTPDDVRALRCPACSATLTYRGRLRRGKIDSGALLCEGCTRPWPVRDGLAQLYDDDNVRGVDRLMRCLYDGLAPLHDPAVHWLLPVLQGSGAEPLRNAYMHRLELDRLRPPHTARILEVGAGSGANLPLLERDLGGHLDVELWAADLSNGMLKQYRQRLRSHHGHSPRLLLADAHALPFADRSFDRVFHIGGIAGYHDPRRALAEMARVARPDTPIVVVDEQLDPDRSHGPYYWLTYQLLTFYNPGAACPRDLLPAGASSIVEEQISRFYYCLTFRMPAPRRRKTRRISRAPRRARKSP